MSPSSGDAAGQTLAGEAMALLKAGDVRAARAKSEQGLAQYPRHIALLQSLGLSALQLGDADTAVEALQTCLNEAPDNPGLWEILGGGYEIQNRMDDALEAYAKAIAIETSRASAHQYRGVLLVRMQRFEEGRETLDRALELNENDAVSWLWWATAQYSTLDLDEAERGFTKAVTLKPDWGQAWIFLAAVLADLGRHREAISKYEKGLELAPDDLASLRLFAMTLTELQHEKQAEQILKKALNIEAKDSQTLATLASLYERQNRMEEAQETVQRALAENPNNPLALKVNATLIHRGGNREEALGQMKKLATSATSWSEKESIYFDVAQLHDKLGNIDEAYETFVAANRLHRDAAISRHIDPESYRAQVKREADILANAPPENAIVPPAQDPPDPVFLMGFPRSGTTLLDQVLDSHPDVVVMEERPPLADVHKRLTELENDAGRPFTQLDDEQRQVARQFYFQRAATFVSGLEGKTFVDKLPLATAKIRIIKLIFPKSRILFALRHPCDVVLSCFMQRFQINIAMANFYTLADAVQVYAQVMGLWRDHASQMDFQVHFVRYEDLVSDFNTQVSQALAFLGVPWDDRVAAFHEHALNRDVRTASSRQVTQPLYTSALARWQKYNRYLEPHLETLQPFIDAFGYAE